VTADAEYAADPPAGVVGLTQTAQKLADARESVQKCEAIVEDLKQQMKAAKAALEMAQADLLVAVDEVLAEANESATTPPPSLFDDLPSEPATSAPGPRVVVTEPVGGLPPAVAGRLLPVFPRPADA